MTEFTPIQSLAGGALIGVAVVMLMALHGRIAGVSGIIGGLLPPNIAFDWQWRAAFLGGMVVAPLLYTLVLATQIPFASPSSYVALVVGGIMVGIGVTYGSGCTSGHGVCGLARFSIRSFAAVLTFMTTAAVTVFVTRHILGG